MMSYKIVKEEVQRLAEDSISDELDHLRKNIDDDKDHIDNLEKDIEDDREEMEHAHDVEDKKHESRRRRARRLTRGQLRRLVKEETSQLGTTARVRRRLRRRLRQSR